MIRLDHLAIPVRDSARSRDWYTKNFGFKVEFEVPERKTVALQDDSDLTLFLIETSPESVAPSCTLTFQVDDVQTTYRDLSRRGSRSRRLPKSFTGDMVPYSEIQMGTSSTFGTSGRCVKRVEADLR